MTATDGRDYSCECLNGLIAEKPSRLQPGHTPLPGTSLDPLTPISSTSDRVSTLSSSNNAHQLSSWIGLNNFLPSQRTIPAVPNIIKIPMSKFNICLVQPDNYIHSYAFLELGELIQFSLKELGHDATLGFNKIESGRKNILIGCHLLDPSLIPKLPASTIILNTEQLYDDTTPWNRNILNWSRDFEVWDYSKRNMEKFQELGITHAKHFKIGFQKELARLAKDVNKDVDILFYGCINERRRKILQALSEKGLNVKVLFGVYGKERDQWIERSRVVLNHHFYDSQIFEIVRVFYLLTNSVAVVAEVNESTSIDSIYKEGIFPASYDQIASSCLELIIKSPLRLKLQESALDAISRYPQKLFTEALLS